MKIELTTVIKRPIEEVFEFLSNAENNPKWDLDFVEAKKTSEGPIGVGTTWRFVQKVFGQRLESKAEVTEYEPNWKSTLESKSPFPMKGQFTFESVEGATQVTFKVEVEPGGFFKLAEPLLATMMKRQGEADFANLKAVMEADAV